MKPELSIIIPCYNCETTLEDAIKSVYMQNLIIPFEIVMVDDGSTDGTRKLIKKLSQSHKEIKYIFHEKNLGGGAARNTAIENSKGNIIFCLDSDDILGENCLNNMYKTLIDNKLDGVTISKSIKFLDRVDNIQYITEMDFVNSLIPFESLLDKNYECGLYSTFMHTRKIYEITKGYPTEHGFDTQGFAFRFLINGFKAMAAPNSIYYHRLSRKNNSYYNREYKLGRINFNWFKVFEEFIYIFNDEVKEKILAFDIYGNLAKKDIMSIFKTTKNIYSLDYRNFISKNSKKKYFNFLNSKTKLNKYEYYWLYVYTQNINYLIKAICEGINYPYQYKQLFSYIYQQNGDNFDIIYDKINKNFIKQNLFIKFYNRMTRLFKWI